MTNEELVRAYRDGNKSALDEILDKNKGMVYKVVLRYKGFCNGIIEIDDLIQEGNIGLIVAADKYDFKSDKKASFSTYAFFWIRQKILRFLQSKYKGQKEISLWSSIGDDLELADTLADSEDHILKAEETIWYKDIHNELEEVMHECLSLKQREVIELRYGFDKVEPATIESVSEMLGLKVKDVKSLESKSLMNIRRSKWGRLRVLEMRQEHDSR